MDYTYDADNRIIAAAPTSPSEGDKRLAFWYDGLNRCVKRNTYTRLSGNWSLTSELFLYYDTWNLIEERDGSGTHLASFVNGPTIDEPIARLTTNATYYYHGDALNSTVAMTDVDGDVAERYAYEVFGLPTIMDAVGNYITNTAIGIRHLFQGREWLAEVRLYDHRNRYYAPELHRWLTRDPMGELSFSSGPSTSLLPSDAYLTADMYSFVRNLPTRMVDPLGLTYIDISIGGPIFGLIGWIGGVTIGSTGIHPYLGVGLSTPGVSGSITVGGNDGDGHGSAEPSPGWNWMAEFCLIGAMEFGGQNDTVETFDQFEIGVGWPPDLGVYEIFVW